MKEIQFIIKHEHFDSPAEFRVEHVPGRDMERCQLTFFIDGFKAAMADRNDFFYLVEMLNTVENALREKLTELGKQFYQKTRKL